jgi:hypothetical protein
VKGRESGFDAVLISIAALEGCPIFMIRLEAPNILLLARTMALVADRVCSAS